MLNAQMDFLQQLVIRFDASLLAGAATVTNQIGCVNANAQAGERSSHASKSSTMISKSVHNRENRPWLRRFRRPGVLETRLSVQLDDAAMAING
jgi:hypothetical protein